MDNRLVEKRRGFIINFIYFALIIGVFYVLVNYALGYIFPFVFAAVLAVILQKPVRFIVKKLHLKAHGAVSILLVLLIVVSIIGALFLVGRKLIEEIANLVGDITERYSSLNDFIIELRGYIDAIILKLPGSVQEKAMTAVDNIVNKISAGTGDFDLSFLSVPLTGAWNVVKGIPSFLISIIVTIVSCVFMTSEYDLVRDMILGMCSEEKGKKLIESKRVISKGVGKLVKAYVTIMAITFAEVFLGLYLMKLIGVYNSGYIAIIAFVVCVVDIVPVLGTGTVVIPWAVFSFVTGNIGLGIGLIILYVVITILRQAIEPKLVASQVGLPSIVTIMAMFLGARLFGIFGVLLLPFSVIVLKLMYDEGVIGSKNTLVSTNAEKCVEEVSE